MIDAIVYQFGPLLYKTNVSKKDLAKVKKLCSKTNKDARHTLAGVINHEYEIDEKKYAQILQPYLQLFQKEWHRLYNSPLQKLKCTSAWVNYMKKGEANPPHIHTNCDLSSVMYLQIPKKLKQENKNYKGTSAGPGGIVYSYGENRDFTVHEYYFFPEEAQLFVFPYNLRHYVIPFKSEGERISVAANLKILC